MSINGLAFLAIENGVLCACVVCHSFSESLALLGVVGLLFAVKLLRLSSRQIVQLFLPSLLCLHLVTVSLGAPILDRFLSTLLFALFLTCTAVQPTFPSGDDASWTPFLKDRLSLLMSNPLADASHAVLIGSLIGGWSSAFFYPLDWDRPWQLWPIPSVTCSYLGGLAALGLFLIKKLFH